MVRRILQKHLPSNINVWVFGSRAKWTTHDGSDLDLAVEGDQPINHHIMIDLSIEFDDSDLPYTVDVVDLKTINSKFKQIIDAQKIPLEMNDTSWYKIPVSEVATVIIGGTPSRIVPDYWHGNIQWVTAKDIAENDSRYLYGSQDSITDAGLSKSPAKIMPKNTILVTARGTVGALTQLGKEMAFNQTCYALVPNECVDADYLYYALKSTSTQMKALTYRTIFQTITAKSFKEWLIPIPPLDKQRIIAHILGSLDAKIDLNHKMNETLETMVRALFKSWFVDFEPVRAKIDGRWRSGKSLPGLPAHLYDLFPDRLVNSKFGSMPESWAMVELDRVARQCKTSINPREIEPNTPHIALEHMPKHCIALSKLSVAIDSASNKYVFKRGDILFGKLRPYFQKVGVAPVDGVCSTDIIVISPISQNWFGFILGHVSSTEFTDYVSARSTGTKMPRTNWTDMGRYNIVLPKLELAKHFTDIVHTFIDKIILNIHNSRMLAIKRDLLLSKLMSGKVLMQNKRLK